MTDEPFKLEGGFEPVKPGISKAYDTEHGGYNHLSRHHLGSSTRLSDIQDDYGFYHPGLMYAHIPLEGNDPFYDFARHKNNSELKPLGFVVGQEFIHDPDQLNIVPLWRRTIHAMEKPLFDEYLKFVTSTAFVDRNSKTLWKIGLQHFRLLDPSCDEYPYSTRTIGVTFFGLDTNKGMWYYKYKDMATITLAKTSDMYDDTRLMAEAMFKDNLESHMENMNGN